MSEDETQAGVDSAGEDEVNDAMSFVDHVRVIIAALMSFSLTEFIHRNDDAMPVHVAEQGFWGFMNQTLAMVGLPHQATFEPSKKEREERDRLAEEERLRLEQEAEEERLRLEREAEKERLRLEHEAKLQENLRLHRRLFELDDALVQLKPSEPIVVFVKGDKGTVGKSTVSNNLAAMMALLIRVGPCFIDVNPATTWPGNRLAMSANPLFDRDLQPDQRSPLPGAHRETSSIQDVAQQIRDGRIDPTNAEDYRRAARQNAFGVRSIVGDPEDPLDPKDVELVLDMVKLHAPYIVLDGANERSAEHQMRALEAATSTVFCVLPRQTESLTGTELQLNGWANSARKELGDIGEAKAQQIQDHCLVMVSEVDSLEGLDSLLPNMRQLPDGSPRAYTVPWDPYIQDGEDHPWLADPNQWQLETTIAMRRFLVALLERELERRSPAHDLQQPPSKTPQDHSASNGAAAPILFGEDQQRVAKPVPAAPNN